MTSETKTYSHLPFFLTIVSIILFCVKATAQNQSDSCDWNRIEELGEIFKDTLGPKPLIVPDPNNPNVGILNITRNRIPEILTNDYFESCLKGKEPVYFINLLGSADLAPTRTVHDKSGYLITYSMQLYDHTGKPLDPLPSTFIIEFDSEKRAITMYTISY